MPSQDPRDVELPPLIYADRTTVQGSQHSLSPTDHGKGAWLALAGSSLIQIPVWGFPLSFGVFQDFYTKKEPSIARSGAVAVIGSCASGVLYLCAPFTFALLTKYPRLRPWCGPVGLFIALVGLILSSFATQAWQLIATQGVLCAIGSSLLFAPSTICLDEWFFERKGLAFGIMGSAKSATGVFMPLVLNACLERWSFRVTLRAWSVVMLVLTAPLLRYTKGRLPISQSTAPRRLDTSFLKNWTFWAMQSGNIIQSLGYFLPATYLPIYTESLGFSNITGILLLSALNGASVLGSFAIGLLNDKLQFTTAILISSVGSAIAALLFWGLSARVAMLVLFASTHGFFAGGYSSTWPGILNEVKNSSPNLESGLVFGLLTGGRGIGNVISGPLSIAMLGDRYGKAHKSIGYQSDYQAVIIFTGITAIFGGWGWLWKQVKYRNSDVSV